MIIDFLLDDIREAIADIQEDVSGLTETSFADVDYVASAKTIYFYNVLGEELGTIDTTDFVIDGMVDNVTLSGSILSITFNTDAGKETINIDLNDFINPEYYWTSAQTKDYVDSGDTATYAAASAYTDEAIAEALAPYWDSAATKEYVDSADTAILAEVGELSGVVQEQQIVFSSGYNELHTQVMELSGVAQAHEVKFNDYYTSGETDEAIAEAIASESARCESTYLKEHQSLAAYYTSAQTDEVIAETLTAYTPTTGFSTINGSAITNGSAIVIQGGGGSYTAGANINISQENMISVSGLSTINGSAITDGGNIVIQGGGGGDPTTLKSVSEFNPNAENGDVQSKFVETPGLPAGVSFVTGNTYGAYQNQFGGTLTIPAGFAAGTTEQDPIYLMSVISNEDSTIYTVYTYENPWHPGGVMLDIYRGEREYQAPELELSLYPAGGEYGENNFGGPDYNEVLTNYVPDETFEGNMIVEFYAGYDYGDDRQYADPSFNTEASTEYGLYIKAEDGWKEISTPEDVVTSSYISNIWKGTQAEYDALAPDYDPNTFYIIVSN